MWTLIYGSLIFYLEGTSLFWTLGCYLFILFEGTVLLWVFGCEVVYFGWYFVEEYEVFLAELGITP